MAGRRPWPQPPSGHVLIESHRVRSADRALAYLGLKAYLAQVSQAERERRVGVFLATAHPAKFREIVEPIIGRDIDMPPALAEALAQPPTICRMPAALDAVVAALEA